MTFAHWVSPRKNAIQGFQELCFAAAEIHGSPGRLQIRPVGPERSFEAHSVVEAPRWVRRPSAGDPHVSMRCTGGGSSDDAPPAPSAGSRQGAGAPSQKEANVELSLPGPLSQCSSVAFGQRAPAVGTIQRATDLGVGDQG
jgi:hypothetical protein